MKIAFAVALAALGWKTADAACPNACSGQGRCTNYAATFSVSPLNVFKPLSGGSVNALGYDTSIPKKDSCTCFLRSEDGTDVYSHTGADCSQRTCPSGPALHATPYADNSHQQIMECSNVGTCNRELGVCECHDQYTGKNCGRRKCPNDCNNRGICTSMQDIAKGVAAANAYLSWTSTSHVYTSSFDATSSYGCICDKGYRGADCSLVECPSDVDPMGGSGKAEGHDCSGRGRCDYSTGNCACHTGFFGTACEKQTSNMV
mmetsp:Transcript_12245/g.19897  ORF Transcript_12245/g.19897 Transcript_12245/m.19897 type:complete len:260 (-) Transcript_12245:664-1443(-)